MVAAGRGQPGNSQCPVTIKSLLYPAAPRPRPDLTTRTASTSHLRTSISARKRAFCKPLQRRCRRKTRRMRRHLRTLRSPQLRSSAGKADDDFWHQHRAPSPAVRTSRTMRRSKRGGAGLLCVSPDTRDDRQDDIYERCGHRSTFADGRAAEARHVAARVFPYTTLFRSRKSVV